MPAVYTNDCWSIVTLSDPGLVAVFKLKANNLMLAVLLPRLELCWLELWSF